MQAGTPWVTAVFAMFRGRDMPCGGADSDQRRPWSRAGGPGPPRHPAVPWGMAIMALRRFAPLIIAVAGLAALVLASATRASLWVHLVVLVVTLGLASVMGRRRRAPTAQAQELYASDAYSDASLGRRAPTHPAIDTRPQGQYGPGLPIDPLRLPEERPRA